MRRSIATIILIAAAALLAASGGVLWNALRNAHPAIRGTPSESIGPTERVPQTAAPQPSPPATNTTGMPLRLPAGFSISIFARNLGSPRVMTWDPAGNLLVSITASGKVVALPDANADGVADRIVPVVEGLNRPHGLAFRCETQEACALYIAETDHLAVYDYDAATLRAFNRRTLVDLPSGSGHFTRTLLFLPHPNEDILLISVGSSCNVCEETDWRRAKILSYNVKTGELNEFAKGLRNAVFMTLHPVSGEVWATEMGRDWLGDDLPPDELNIIEEGRDYGWPICYGKNIHDAEFDKKVYVRDPCADKTPSFIDIPAHSAPLGLAFFPEEGWPEEYWHDLLVAYHGSWNRSVPTGYKIVRYHLDSRGNYLGEEDFITGWLTPAGALGRPVDILIQPGGVIYVSDDKAGLIYRITH